jgi:hypothetical protein
VIVTVGRVGRAGRTAYAGVPQWTPANLTYAPVYLFDTAVAASITEASGNVSALADARRFGSWGVVCTGSGATRPELHPEIVVDGRPAIVYTNTAANTPGVKLTDGNSGAINNQPFALYLVAHLTAASDYGPMLTLGGNQTSGPTFPENANIGTLSSRDWSGYLAQNPNSGGFIVGRNGSEGRLAVDTSGPCSYLLVSDGTRTKFLRNGRTMMLVDGLTWATKSAEIQLGGASVTNFGNTPTHRQYYGFVQRAASGTMTEAEIRALGAWSISEFPSLPHPRMAIVHGTSIDRDYPNGTPDTAWLAIAADLSDLPWEVQNYSVVGMGAGKLPNAFGTALYGVGGTATAPTAGLGTVAAAQWSSIWDISASNVANVFFTGTLAENDIYFRASAAECFTYYQVLGALTIASGGQYAVCTPAARAGTGTPSVFVTNATNATPIEITCNLAHGLTTGASVGIRGVLGNTAANGTWTVTATSTTKFTLDTSVGNGAYTANSGVGYWTGNVAAYEAERSALLALIAAHWQGDLGAVLVLSASNASPIAITTELPHGLVTGDVVSLAQVLGNTAANGIDQTITVTGPSSFTLDGSTGNGAYTGAGVVYWGDGLGGSFLVDFAASPPFNDPSDNFWYEDDKDHWKAPLQELAGSIAATAAFGYAGG